ncbi:programmed cell death protein [Dermatophagoides farinae]|uniref:Programmed cell death protein n=1 Tax=Dermatophagoides farinae TaxID=6954 RepID=A0A922LBT2_DERFA|nr:programmed cell death protein [Dermatophagoides farinae]
METKLFDDDWGDDGQSLINDSTLTESSSESIITKKYDFEKYSHFIPHYISVIDEPSNESIDKEKYEKIAKQIVIVEENNSITEEYEKHYPEAFKNDKDNYRFYKQLRKCPEQIMRYEWSGVFEVQLMPSLINILWNNKKKTIENDDDTSLDFETILFYTCGRNCNRTDNIHEEQVFVFKENCPTLNEQSFEFIPEQKNQKTK